MNEKTVGEIFYRLLWLAFVFFPLIFITGLLLKIPLDIQFKAQLFILAAGFFVFFIDLFLQTVLSQNLSWRLIYIVLILVFSVTSLYLLVSSYFFMVGSKEELVTKLLIGGFIYGFLYFCYFTFKKIFIAVWDIDIL